MGVGHPAAVVGDPVHLMTARPSRLSIFPLGGALLFPRMQLPLHIFEPRYCALVSDAMARDRRIGMIQPKGSDNSPHLFAVGCVGRIAHVEALDDGRYNIVLEGVARFRMLSEIKVTTPFRQIEAEIEESVEEPPLASVRRAALERESRRFADAQGYAVDWGAVARLDDESLVNGIAQIAPFDVAAKQALLEAAGIDDRCDLIIQLMQFFGRHQGESGDPVTLQ